MDAGLDPTTSDYSGQRINTLANAVYLRLATPLGSYWADPQLGSRLHELRRQKDLSRVRVLLRQYSEQALAPILADGRARSIDVSVISIEPGRAELQIEAVDQSGRDQIFKHPVKVI